MELGEASPGHTNSDLLRHPSVVPLNTMLSFCLLNTSTCSYKNTTQMNKLHHPHAKLFYMIAELSKKLFINDSERKALKEKVIADDATILGLLHDYDNNKNEDVLADNLINLSKNQLAPAPNNYTDEKKAEPEVEVEPEVEATPEDTDVLINEQPEVTSPVGTLLHKKKIEHSQNVNNEIKKLILQPCDSSQS